MGTEMKVEQKLRGNSRTITLEKILAFEKVVWIRSANTHSDPQVAKERGMAQQIASGQNQLAFMHELLESVFDQGWVRGGKVSMRWLRPVYVGDSVTPCARISAVEDEGGKRRVEMEVWCENQNGDKTSGGTAQAYIQ